MAEETTKQELDAKEAGTQEQQVKEQVAKTETAEVKEVTAGTEETTEEKETPKIELSPAQENPKQFLKDFNWEKYEEGIDVVDDKQLEEFEALVAQNFVDTLR